MKQVSLGQYHNRNSPDDDTGIRPKLRAIVTEEREAFIHEGVGAYIRRLSWSAVKRLNKVLFFQHVIYRRQRSEELSGFMAVNEDMTQWFTDKFRCPRSGLNSVAFVWKYLVPCNTRLQRLRISPSAQFPRGDPEYLAGQSLGKTLNDSFIYDIDHSSFDLKFEMAV